jgi:hypothetical protein
MENNENMNGSCGNTDNANDDSLSNDNDDDDSTDDDDNSLMNNCFNTIMGSISEAAQTVSLLIQEEL